MRKRWIVFLITNLLYYLGAAFIAMSFTWWDMLDGFGRGFVLTTYIVINSLMQICPFIFEDEL